MAKTKTMSAVVCHGPRDYRLEEVPIPERGPGEALVEVEAVGICASDLKCFNGAVKFWGDAEPPAVRRDQRDPRSRVRRRRRRDRRRRESTVGRRGRRPCRVRADRAVLAVPLLPPRRVLDVRREQRLRLQAGDPRWHGVAHGVPSRGPRAHRVEGPSPGARRVHRTAGLFAARRRARRDLVRRCRGRRRMWADRPRHGGRSGGQVAGQHRRSRCQ